MSDEAQIKLHDSPDTVISGLRFPEGNRWHDGALWFSDMHSGEVFRWSAISSERPHRVLQVRGQSSGLGWLPGVTSL